MTQQGALVQGAADTVPASETVFIRQQTRLIRNNVPEIQAA